MIEFWGGFLTAILCYLSYKVSKWVSKTDYKMIRDLEDNDYDFNEIEKNWQELINSPYDPENYFKPEGTK